MTRQGVAATEIHMDDAVHGRVGSWCREVAVTTSSTVAECVARVV